MTDRERWIVYPLLLLTMGIALHDKFGVAKEVRAHRIVLLNKDDVPQVVLDSTKSGGVIRAISADQTMQLTLGHEDNTASLYSETATADGLATRALLGDLRGFTPQRLLHWLGHWPLLDPRLNRIAQPAADAGAAKPVK
jgi:hypothetical protein